MTRIRAGCIDWETFAEDAQARMTERGWSKRHLTAESGVAESTLRRVWRGEGGMTADAWAAVALVLGLELDLYLTS